MLVILLKIKRFVLGPTLGDRKGIRPVKTEWWGAGMVI